jgi:RimJ/RimL family protein N-acetyltransferase
MSDDLLCGELVRLEALDPAAHAAYFARWSADSEYERLLDSDPTRPRSAAQTKAELEKLLEGTDDYLFLVRALEGDVPIGMVELDDIAWARGDAWVGIGLGERTYWGKGYGTDALRILLRFAFDELNLHRVTLNVFSYNTRALRTYAGLGFTVEGTVREALMREGRRWDLIFMGLLRREWEATRIAP